ncbi:DUF4153 domain-containing protein [Sphingopyxis sp. BSN-002]|uniref:DUF4153 domain-containing protein n=1 Tax=Sphingopyxis sp. BSN-002 TaxID=2911495 RepID=UPI001EDC9113|nr:DUF4153 domain-containing protein [Sphingopyxis sp. BSN-002]UKK85374.1 DUF4153 domain-containing protein [Sphingopyxis sp. BSN-002]
MTDAPATPPVPESNRLDGSDPPWPLRPWIMAAICALAGLAFHLTIDWRYAPDHDPGRNAFAAFITVATLVFVLGVELRRWTWAAGFALAWGAVIALIVWTSAGYNVDASPFEWPFWSGLLAVLIATPLFQTRRDVAPDWRFWKLWQMPYERLHSHAWADAVIGAAGLAFTGLTFLLVLLIGSMFELIGIKLIMRMFETGWFPWMLAGAAFGGAVGLLRERDKLVATLQKLVMIVLAVLAPVLAVAVVLFLLSLVGTGLTPLWESGFSTAALMMGAAAFAVLLANAVIGNGREERSGNRFLHGAAAVLVVAVLPLAIIAFYSMHLRVIQYGWTPERIWGAIAAMVALAYGAVGLWAVVRGKRDFDDVLRPLQQRLAIGLTLVALFLALPIMDFGAISTRDQLARLQKGTVKADKFDWAALAFDFGPSGRAALAKIAKSPDKAKADLAKWALQTKNRWDLTVAGEPVDAADVAYGARPIREKVRVLPAGQSIGDDAYKAIEDRGQCRTAPCAAYVLDADRMLVVGEGNNVVLFARDAKTKAWQEDYQAFSGGAVAPGPTSDEVEKAAIEVRPVTRRQLFVNGKPVGEDFE